MQYRKIPFFNARSGTPLSGLGISVPRRLPFIDGMGNYGAEFPNSSFLGATMPAATTTVILRPQPGATPGWPGFFGWLAATHPDVYNYAKVALPQRLGSSTEGHRTGGATLQGLLGLGDDLTNASNSGDDTIDPGLTTIDAGPIFVTPPTVTIADSGESSSSPTFTAAGTAQIVNTLTQAASTLIPAINQQQIFQAQLSRAAAGLPPLNTAAYGLATGGVTSALTSPTMLLLLGGAVLLAVMLGKKS
jgi:hypothetical protein